MIISNEEKKKIKEYVDIIIFKKLTILKERLWDNVVMDDRNKSVECSRVFSQIFTEINDYMEEFNHDR